MNRIYRIVKNKKTGLWMVASETAKSNGGGGSASVVVAAAICLIAPAGVCEVAHRAFAEVETEH